ncbi:hypothetical protein ASPACDRAFT_111286 [Aspergillus aculeatus ATCC 16872]|uniref:F-box domain-containing protein n=1 Tax=Aspergillus aculeatus (strain ATCC 16872 / CBS 172.66 / WB 5094) TaxID=690307 RepID=A0A1L9X4X9_ASPA1|nr:uncharacterized protein ASPACDRAFT_111286 [Aspergillus aculeatus ATCC 16872]OJK03502.1 hypothetical protein ASPACDRAFT_111286 [Aspergillus aculeatus ATCC 16872]
MTCLSMIPTFARGSRSPNYESQPNRSMSNAEASRIFHVPEILEGILLGLDIYTLLISARVCHSWNSLIKSSRKIQQALFYIPVDAPVPQHPRTKNPLITDISWPEFIHRQLLSYTRPGPVCCFEIPDMASKKSEAAYLRPEASWQNMLLQQPPNCIVRLWNPRRSDLLYCKHRETADSHVRWKPNGDYLRLKNVVYYIDAGTFTPSPWPFLCFANGFELHKVMWKPERRDQMKRNPDLGRYLASFDLTVNTASKGCWPVVITPPDQPRRTARSIYLPSWFSRRDVRLSEDELC